MCVLVCGICVIAFPVPILLTSPVLAELRQADLITSEECNGLSYLSGVIRVQSVKSLAVVTETADVLRRHGFESESKLLPGRQSSPSSICLCYVVQWSLLMTDTL